MGFHYILNPPRSFFFAECRLSLYLDWFLKWDLVLSHLLLAGGDI